MPDEEKRPFFKRFADWVERGIVAISDVVNDVDGRALVGLCLIILGITVIMTPPGSYTTVMWLADHGLSPRGYGIGLAICGAVILKWTGSDFYGLILTIAFIPYLLGTYGLAITDKNIVAPPVLYTFMFILMLIVPKKDGDT